jgi:hypothetical protein
MTEHATLVLYFLICISTYLLSKILTVVCRPTDSTEPGGVGFCRQLLEIARPVPYLVEFRSEFPYAALFPP